MCLAINARYYVVAMCGGNENQPEESGNMGQRFLYLGGKSTARPADDPVEFLTKKVQRRDFIRTKF